MKYIASPFGDVLGKLGDTIGGKWKGIRWIRKRVLPAQRGTITLYREFKDGHIPADQFSFLQFNLRHVVFNMLVYLARANKQGFMAIWKEYCLQHDLKLTGVNKFLKDNATSLYEGMPDKGREYDIATNELDLVHNFTPSVGDLYPTAVASAQYASGTGALTVTWGTALMGNQADTDMPYLLVLQKPILESIGRDGTWKAAIVSYAFTGSARSAGTLTVTLPTGIVVTNLVVSLYFRSADVTVGYSRSGNAAVAPA